MKNCEMHKEIRQAAMGLLARREHAGFELRRKLSAKGFEDEAVATVVAELAAENLLSDDRYTEAYVRSRAQKGYGPCRIRMELQEQRVDDELIAHYLEQSQDWYALAETVRNKRFGPKLPDEYKERARQQRFLQYRGFSSEQIAAAMRQTELE